MKQIPLSEAQGRLGELVLQLSSENGIALTEGGKIVARLLPPETAAASAPGQKPGYRSYGFLDRGGPVAKPKKPPTAS